MALDLRVVGPGLDVVHRLEEGQPELVLGRDADCGVCLPDPQRNVSRRHLAVWLEAGELHFHVLSVINGVDMAFGEAPPGARGVLPAGQTLRLAEYTVSASAATAAPSAPDPWAVFDREGSGAYPLPVSGPAPAASDAASDDPFGDWGFETTFGPGAPGGGPLDAGTLGPGSLPAFFQGLGLDATSLGPLSQGEIQAIGRLVRMLALGILELHAAAGDVKEDLRSEDRTMVAARDNNPLKTGLHPETKLRYLFGGRAAGVGFMGPERALRELLAELVAHDRATGVASRAALAATLKEFAPAALKDRLLDGGSPLFEGTRAWSAYSKYYEEQGQDLAAWTQRLLDRYFTEAYLRESMRIKRETPGR
ncbi:MAG TPA: type VI secretion system-associated FHA domain protein [Ramlibacter sp.]|nr:type VI secretion system-associated FHA domain protein [Ramlibacter sp.]